MSVTIHSAQVLGLDARLISVEVDISPGLHLFSIVGLADKEIQESRQRIAAAIKNLGGLAPHKKSQRVIVNLAPADIKKEGPAFDLPIALGFLLASGQISFNPEGKLFLGELGLDGTLRRVPGVLAAALEAKAAGFKEMILPEGNGAEAAMVQEIEIRQFRTLNEVYEYLSGRKDVSSLGQPNLDGFEAPAPAIDFKDIKGQSSAKRALEIAAAGGHHVLMQGPPGAGKTILASALVSILPPLSRAELFEVTKIHGIAGILGDGAPFMAGRPFRAPHHTSSHTAVIGGGSYPRPGEVTLAHRGVLFLDEFPEFDRRVIEALRQPLEQHTITVARTSGVFTFPAQFTLIAAMNPCPCGNFGNPDRGRDCSCSPGAVSKYRKKISGPITDRMDLFVETPPVAYEKLEDGADEESSDRIRKRVLEARQRQYRRFGGEILTNAQMQLCDLKRHIRLNPEVKSALQLAHNRYRLSARSYHRLLKVSRTIADLDGSEEITGQQVAEALQYRPKEEV